MSSTGSLPDSARTVGTGDNVSSVAVDAEESLRPKTRPVYRQPIAFAKANIALILLLILIIAGSFISDKFLTLNNLRNILWAVSILGIVSMGQTLLLITKNFDMSISMVVPFVGVVTIGLQIQGWELMPSIAGGVLAGCAVGVLNGALVVITKANPFLITLGTQTLVYSISLALTEAKTWYGTIPDFNVIGRGKLFNEVHYSIVIFLALAVILEFVLRRTAYGRSLYVIGINEEAGRLSGVLVKRIKLFTFTFCAFTAALGGIVMSSRLNSTNASGAVGMDFDSIIAVVLGGTSLFGGSGGTLRTVIGVLVLGILDNLMVLARVPYEGQFIGKGLVFLLVVGISTNFNLRR